MKDKFNTLLHIALQKHATDIHFVYTQHLLEITMRCDEGVIPLCRPSTDASLFHYLKYIAHLDLGFGDIAQSGNFQYEFHNQLLQFRFSLLSTMDTQTAVLRILNMEKQLSIDTLSMQAEQTVLLKKWCQLEAGLILFSGPTGSGKTTTLHTLLHHIATMYHKRIVTLEDPIEIIDHEYLQLQINERHNFTYEMGIREVLRHDPDVIMIGEIRDVHTARMAIRIALSGHLVFSTVHAKNGLEVLYRMHELGISYDDLEATIQGISAQRLCQLSNDRKKQCLYELVRQDELAYFYKNKKFPEHHQKIEIIVKQMMNQGVIMHD